MHTYIPLAHDLPATGAAGFPSFPFFPLSLPPHPAIYPPRHPRVPDAPLSPLPKGVWVWVGELGRIAKSKKERERASVLFGIPRLKIRERTAAS